MNSNCWLKQEILNGLYEAGICIYGLEIRAKCFDLGEVSRCFRCWESTENVVLRLLFLFCC